MSRKNMRQSVEYSILARTFMESATDFEEVDAEIRSALVDSIREASTYLPRPVASIFLATVIPLLDMLLFILNNAIALLGPVRVESCLPGL